MSKNYSIRIGFVFLVLCFLYIVILFNLYLIQVRHHPFFSSLGEKQYNVTITTTPPRAPIVDRSGKQLLAMNKESLSAFILPKTIQTAQVLEPFLQQYFPHAYLRLLTHRASNFMYVKRRLTDDEIQLINESNIDDIKLLHEPNRWYPVESAAHIIGITDVDNNGLFGIELQFNTLLAGKPTTYLLEKDARSGHFYFKKETKITGKTGEPVTLTIDSDLQFLAHEELKETVETVHAQEGAVLIIDPNNGDILAMTVFPNFDPNNHATLNLEQTKNKIVSQQYELGSVIKVFAALAALEEGVVTSDEIIDCKNTKTTYIDGRRVNTWKGHGCIPFDEIIAVSNNIGIAIVAKRLNDKLFEHYTRLGFGQKTGISFPGEQKGFVNPPHRWSKQSIISLSYGYEMSATLLQLGKAFCIIANNGYTIQPKLIMHPDIYNKQHDNKQLYSTESINAIKAILKKTTVQGTARRAGIKGYTIMSKTGTANLLIDGKYSPNNNIFTCAGIVEKDGCQRVIITFIKEVPKQHVFASTIAAPLFERVAQKVLIHDKMI